MIPRPMLISSSPCVRHGKATCDPTLTTSPLHENHEQIRTRPGLPTRVSFPIHSTTLQAGRNGFLLWLRAGAVLLGCQFQNSEIQRFITLAAGDFGDDD